MLNYTLKHIESSGVPVVLLHGFLEASTMWEQVKFPTDTPIVCVDLPGHGKSNNSESICDSIQGMAKAVVEVINQLGLKQYHIIGHSMGGYVALEVKKTDKFVDQVMLLNSNFWADSPQKVIDRLRVANVVQTNKSHFIYEVIPNLFVNPESFDQEVKALINEALEMSPDAIAKASIAMSKREDLTDFVLKNAKDFTCVQGVEDSIVPAEKMRSALSGSNVKYIELEEVGHMAHFEASEKLDGLLATFLK